MKVSIFKNNIAGAVKHLFIKYKLPFFIYKLFLYHLPHQTTQNLPGPIIQRWYQI